MTLDLNTVSERSKYRFNNYFQRFVKSKTRGFDFEGMVAGFLDGNLALSLNSPFDVITPMGDQISCKVVRNTSEKVSLKSIRKSTQAYISAYSGSEENKRELERLSEYPNFVELLTTHKNPDIRNQSEDILSFLLKEITGLLIGVPNYQRTGIELYYYDKSKLIALSNTPDLLNTSKTKGGQTITFSAKILKLDKTMEGFIQFPIVTQEQYAEFLIGDEKTKEIVNIFNTMGEKYGVPRLGDNIPQDIIRNLSKNERFKLDIRRILK